MTKGLPFAAPGRKRVCRGRCQRPMHCSAATRREQILLAALVAENSPAYTSTPAPPLRRHSPIRSIEPLRQSPPFAALRVAVVHPQMQLRTPTRAVLLRTLTSRRLVQATAVASIVDAASGDPRACTAPWTIASPNRRVRPPSWIRRRQARRARRRSARLLDPRWPVRIRARGWRRNGGTRRGGDGRGVPRGGRDGNGTRGTDTRAAHDARRSLHDRDGRAAMRSVRASVKRDTAAACPPAAACSSWCIPGT